MPSALLDWRYRRVGICFDEPIVRGLVAWRDVGWRYDSTQQIAPPTLFRIVNNRAGVVRSKAALHRPGDVIDSVSQRVLLKPTNSHSWSRHSVSVMGSK